MLQIANICVGTQIENPKSYTPHGKLSRIYFDLFHEQCHDEKKVQTFRPWAERFNLLVAQNAAFNFVVFIISHATKML